MAETGHETRIETRLEGLGVSAGISIGRVLVYRPDAVSESAETRPAEAGTVDAAQELERLAAAKEQALQELEALVERTKQTLGEDKAVILAGQQSFLADPSFYPEMQKRISNQGMTAETAVQAIVDQFVAIFGSMQQEYMRERASDLKDVGQRLLGHLRGRQGVQLSDIREEVILVADDLTPSDTVQLDKNLILGIVTRIGGKTSHTAILAKSLGIPAVLGVGERIEALQNGDELILDGQEGVLILTPDESTVATYRTKQQEERGQSEFLMQYAHRPAVTEDGHRIEVAANIGTAAEAGTALEQGAEGVGLFRTEFLFMGVHAMPTEDEQYTAYREAAERMEGKPVVIRTLDIGGDKELPYLELEKEMNPFLGYRAIRLCLDRPELLKTQVRAILRASRHGQLKIMFPMISNLTEWRQAKAIVEAAQRELQAEGVAYDEKLEVGIMVEIPSAALLADAFAQEVDFFSIGTNDLVQYTVAVDRMNEKVAYLYDYFHPAVLRLIQMVIQAAHREGKWVGMCGGMAGDVLAAPLLLGLSLDEWSMDAGSIKNVKHAVSHLNKQACEQLAETLLQRGTAEDIRRELDTFTAR